MKKQWRFTRSSLLLTLLVLLLTSCSPSSPSDGVDAENEPETISSATMSRYRENEIKEYKGAKLDPAVGPRDNSIHGVQYMSTDYYSLSLTGEVVTPLELSYEEVIALDAYERNITLYCVEGWDATILWKGVLMKDLLDLAGINDSAITVIFHSVDGYTTSLPLDTIIDNELILAYQANGLDLPPEMGYPFIFVAEDKLGYKWARWVTGIELSTDADYEGYWEQRGYSNEADIEAKD
jgi:DMSO/TMAO reductase YedYZ molybdopterin-dependent catalytic subunit